MPLTQITPFLLSIRQIWIGEETRRAWGIELHAADEGRTAEQGLAAEDGGGHRRTAPPWMLGKEGVRRRHGREGEWGGDDGGVSGDELYTNAEKGRCLCTRWKGDSSGGNEDHNV